jgi:hypothetical protein
MAGLEFMLELKLTPYLVATELSNTFSGRTKPVIKGNINIE